MSCRIIAVSNVSVGLYNPRGLDIAGLQQHVARRPQHLLEGYTAPGVERITNEKLLESEVDVLIPAALEHQIRGANAYRIKAKFIVEGAGGPTRSFTNAG